MFTELDGSPLHPAAVTDLFNALVEQAGLPPIRLHDLRHGAATFALASGADMKVVSTMLRHSSITITADTYPRSGACRTVPRSKIIRVSGSQNMIHNDGTENDDEYGKAKKQVEMNLDLLL
ncbi:tyrosine-type recombinase/integrase [Lentzea sp. NPDC054927]